MILHGWLPSIRKRNKNLELFEEQNEQGGSGHGTTDVSWILTNWTMHWPVLERERASLRNTNRVVNSFSLMLIRFSKKQPTRLEDHEKQVCSKSWLKRSECQHFQWTFNRTNSAVTCSTEPILARAGTISKLPKMWIVWSTPGKI